MVWKRRWIPFLSLFLIFLILFLVLVGGQASAGAVTFSRSRISTQTGEEETEFVFSVMIMTSEGEPKAPVEVVVEKKSHTMKEIDPQDSNFSDGKEFSYMGKFSEGPKFYYFRCGNQTTRASTFEVKETILFEQYHPDLALAMGIYIIPIAYFLVLIQRMRRNFMTASDSLNRVLSRLENNNMEGKTDPENEKEENTEGAATQEESL